MDLAKLVERFKIFSFGTDPSIGRWLSEDIHPVVAARLLELPGRPISKVQLNQLLVVSRTASVSDGFFQYYWREAPLHPYDTKKVEGYSPEWIKSGEKVVVDIEHLRWGLYRFYIDSLLFFGNVRAAYTSLRSSSINELKLFFEAKRFDSEAISARGPSLELHQIGKDERYLISEMACKTFGDLPDDQDNARDLLLAAWAEHKKVGGGAIRFKDFLLKYVVKSGTQEQYLLSYDDVSGETVDSEGTLRKQFGHVAKRFLDARGKAIKNTELYLSMVNDLDVYVATSMRSRKNFRDMATACEQIFSDEGLAHLHLRYFDPTRSAAKGHEDKGLIECLMVKCAKVLVYCEGEKESYGKDAEAAMALSLGKPVIFFCDHGQKTEFYRDIHPLARLIEFRTGVAVGAIVCETVNEVTVLLKRIFENQMEYRIEQHPSRPGFLKLIEVTTDSVVRLQTNDDMITKTFWNNYNNRKRVGFVSLAAGKEAERLRE